ncbi:DUF58 domain-containing protein [Bacillus sp. FJAT-49732]|uniref:DUF58 domain-containing protein n=1 Tax=Lederbergia citrisecunda TaxID=2833583 RepID=A0A942TL81_9BACI|nr:DUF58 domain-containing protein [Lederbergia citrisecunda]MBS4198781.1 DUF58 domain-containing protein [Lederbergia citrisecunda]
MMMFSHEFLARLRKLRLVVDSKRTGVQKGIRRSHKFGSSLEFSDFRTYQPGDDVRLVDWNVYGRTRRHYIKRYLDEQEIKVSIYMDCTSSMRTIEAKWLLAKKIAAALSYITLVNEDRLSFLPISAVDLRSIERKGSNNAKQVLSDILQLQLNTKTSTFIKEMEKKLQKGRQLTIIITDGMEAIADYEKLFLKAASVKSKILFIHILSKEEIDPDYTGDAKLIDSERETEVNVSISPKLVSAYQLRLKLHNERLEHTCRKFNIQYIFVSDEKTAEELLISDFIFHGIVQ